MNSEFEFLEARLRTQLPELTDAYSNVDRAEPLNGSADRPSSDQTAPDHVALGQTGLNQAALSQTDFDQTTQMDSGSSDHPDGVLSHDEPMPSMYTAEPSPTRRRRYLVGVAAAAAVVVCLGLLGVGIGNRGDTTSTDVADGSAGETAEAFEADSSSTEDGVGSKAEYSKQRNGKVFDDQEDDSGGTSDSATTSASTSSSDQDDRTSTDSDEELVDIESLEPGCGVVPNLVGLSIEEAEKRGRANEPVVTIEQNADLSYNPAIFKEGEVISQTRAGSVVCEQTAVVVSYANGPGISLGSDEVASGSTTTTTRSAIASTTATTSQPKDGAPTCAAIPSLIGLSFDEANRVGTGDLYQVTTHVTDAGVTGDSNIVVGQRPDAGTVVCSDEAPARITIAFPVDANCNIVPNLVGMTAAAAMQAGPATFIHVQQIPDISYDYEAIPLGQVTKQSIQPGTLVCGPDVRSLDISIAAGSTPPTHASTTTTIDDFELPTCITMPDYSGRTAQYAVNDLSTYVTKSGMSFDLNIVQVGTSDYDTGQFSPGEVVAQSVSASTKICSARQVTFTYAE